MTTAATINDLRRALQKLAEENLELKTASPKKAEYVKIKLENDELKKKLAAVETISRMMLKETNGREFTVSDAVVDVVTNSPVVLTLGMIRHLTRAQLMVMILQRETVLYKTIDEYEQSLKARDRHVFVVMKEEILRLQKICNERSNRALREVLKDVDNQSL